MRHPQLLVGSACFLLACGGGADATSTTTTSAPVLPPTLQIGISAPKAFVGDSVTVTWSTQRATSCQASGAWSGAQGAQGSWRAAFATGGVRSFVLACTGGSGTITDSAQLIVPLPVYPTSYENAKNIDTPITPVPTLAPAVCQTNDARAYADFLQEGTLSRFVHGSVYDSITPGTMCLQRRAANGQWVDVTSSYIKDTRGCLHPRKVIVADFNKDKKPDIFTACHGWDRPPYSGEQSILLLSNAQGTYDRFVIPIVAFSHGAAAGDVNGDGYPDILLLDSSHNTYFFLINQGGTGTFVRDDTRLPAYLSKTSYFSTELMDVDGDGILDVLIAGFHTGDANEGPATFLKGSPNGTFTSYAPVVWPSESGCLTTLDFAIRGGAAYLLRECNNYQGFAITKVSMATGAASTLYDAKTLGKTAMWLYLNSGKFVYDDAALALSVVP
jgi:FG-GAP-like repeat